MTMRITGRLASGVGEGKRFTRLEWARAQFVTKLGIDPYPGTVNLIVDDPAELAKWAALRATPGVVIKPSDPQWCDGRCWKVRIGADIDGAIVFPAVPGYPENQIEVIAAVDVRATLKVGDGDTLQLDVREEGGKGATP
jgi:CTP-dependent riboflavin kinase